MTPKNQEVIPFRDGIKTLSVDELARLAEDGRLDLLQYDAMPPAVFFSWSGSLSGVMSALAHDPQAINQTDDHGNTPLLVALWKGRFDVARFLLSCDGVDVNLADEKGMSPLLAVVRRASSADLSGLIGFIQPLIAAGASIDEPLRQAALAGNEETVSRILVSADPFAPASLVWFKEASLRIKSLIESRWLDGCLASIKPGSVQRGPVAQV